MLALIFILIIVAFGVIYFEYGIKDASSQSRSSRLADCVYFSVITWTTVGYGDFVPDSRVSRVVAAYEALWGYISMAALIAAIAAMLTPNPLLHQ